MARQVDNQTFEKEQGDLLDYRINYGDNWLGTDTLATSIWDIPSGIYEVSNTFDDDESIVWVSGGVSGQAYILANTVTTVVGRIKNRDISVRIAP